MYAQISSTETNTHHTHYKKIPANEMSEGNLFRFWKPEINARNWKNSNFGGANEGKLEKEEIFTVLGYSR